jgi:RNA polymerase sigma-70 factor (ECF subfamily)
LPAKPTTGTVITRGARSEKAKAHLTATIGNAGLRRCDVSEGELLKRYAAGEEEAFRQLVSRYKNSLYGFLKRYLHRPELVDDVLQETFLQLYVSRDTFDVSRPLHPWLFTIAANKARDALRRAKSRESAHLGNMVEYDEGSIDDVLSMLDCDTRMPFDDLIEHESAEAVKRVISRMPSKLREIILLAYFHRFPYADIAEILGIPVGTVKSRLHTAVRRFAEDWEMASLCEAAN